MDIRQRIDRLQEIMRDQRIDLVLYGPSPSHQYLTGMRLDWRQAPDLRPLGDLLLVPREGDPVLIVSGGAAAEGCPISTVYPYDPSAGYEGMLDPLIQGFPMKVQKLALGPFLPTSAVAAAVAAAKNAEVCDGSRLMDPLRVIKAPEEVERLRRVARLTDEVMMKVVGEIRPGVSPMDLVLEIEFQARRMGASGLSFGPFAGFVESGSSTAFLASNPDQVTDHPIDRGLSTNTAITFDVGFVLDGYCSDWGRSVYWGTPPNHVKNAHSALRESVVETVAEMKDGTRRACDIYPAVERRLDEYGFGDRLRARLGATETIGHQIGLEVHENPWLKPGVQDPLRAGMVMCIEPKLWLPGEYYLRLEEMVHITETGAEFLTNFDRELFEL